MGDLRGNLEVLLRKACSVRITGADNLPSGACLIVCNHYSLLDGPLLAACLPNDVLFAVDSHTAHNWWAKYTMRLGRAVTIAHDNPFSLRTLAEELKAGGKVMVFPEGRVGRTGVLMKLYEGIAVLWDKGGHPPIVAAHIDGTQRTLFSPLGGRRPVAPVTLALGDPRIPRIDPRLAAKERRAAVMRTVAEAMEDVAYRSAGKEQSLPEALIAAARLHGFGKVVLSDGERNLTYRGLLRGALALSSLARQCAGDHIGIALPTSIAAAVSLFAVLFAGKTPVMLNFTAGEKAVLSACRTAQLRAVWTSTRFLDAAGLEPLAEKMAAADIKVVRLEDAREKMGTAVKMFALLRSLLPSVAAAGLPRLDTANTSAAILFTSGSEGEPKGVALSHRNLLCNCLQTRLRLEVLPHDVLLHTLPMFHSFGLFAVLLGLQSGLRTRLHPNPLQTRLIAEIAYHENATVFFSANAFLARYGKVAHPHDFRSMRLVIAGAEKLAPDTRALWADKFGIRILEGYGVTETSPVIAFNTALANRAGSVGRPVPGLRTELEPVEGVDGGGRLKVAGDNVMMGYLKPENPGQIIPPADGWHDTGDIVEIDGDGFIHVVGRLKRFAKVAGEMVSLGAVEEALSGLWPDDLHCAAAVADPARGEQIVAVTTRADASRAEVSAHFQEAGLSALWVPRRFVGVEQMPLLPTGKPNYRRISEIAQQDA